jgi:hypothetical protein
VDKVRAAKMRWTRCGGQGAVDKVRAAKVPVDKVRVPRVPAVESGVAPPKVPVVKVRAARAPADKVRRTHTTSHTQLQYATALLCRRLLCAGTVCFAGSSSLGR